MKNFQNHYRNYVLEKTPTVDTLGGLNLKVVAAYFVAWLTTALILFRGVKVIGRVATITATVPYFIIAVLFVRSVTLEGAYTGLRFYLLEPDFSTIWDFAVGGICICIVKKLSNLDILFFNI